jgi:hypothetical protein
MYNDHCQREDMSLSWDWGSVEYSPSTAGQCEDDLCTIQQSGVRRPEVLWLGYVPIGGVKVLFCRWRACPSPEKILMTNVELQDENYTPA